MAISAGKNETQRAQTGRSNRGISHGRPVVVPNCAGIVRAGNWTPCETCTARAKQAAATTPIVGAKLEIVFRIDLVKYAVRRKPCKRIDSEYVVEAQTKVKRACSKGAVEKFVTIFERASNRKITLINTEKISSVKRVKY